MAQLASVILTGGCVFLICKVNGCGLELGWPLLQWIPLSQKSVHL